MSSSRRSKRTLKRQLVIRITLIVTAVAVVLALLSTALVARILTVSLDQQLLYAVGATDVSPPAPDAGAAGAPPAGHPRLRPGGLPSGSISLQVTAAGSVQASVVWDYGSGPAPETQIAALLDVPRDGRVRSVRIDDLGEYRAVALESNGTLLAAAAPLTTAHSIIDRMLWIEGLLTLAAAAVAAGVSTMVVRNSLRPLNRLAETATQVAALPLESGEVEIGVRVPDDQVDEESEVGRVGTALNSMLDHVEASLQARQASETRVRQFVADASHELRNPLAAIRGYAELTRRGRDLLPNDTIFALGRIESESQRMSRLVEQMLLLARLDAGPELATTQVDLGETVLNAVSDARAAGPSHVWRIEVPDQPMMIRGDPSQLHQIMVNLLGNARKHTPPGTTVTTSLTEQTGWARITVTDNGPGIAPELLDHIFERFTKADASRAHDAEGSTGLGLAIVAAVAKSHGGRVEVASRQAASTEAGFSRFTVWLPLVGPGVEPRDPV
ncbi:MAG: HAMP domain-containing sensor histidine kinase [Acidobacteriota bacterium]|nr:HAMP domain-containing sensor histidine kinase [Acidobacteriota bacterium]